MFTKPSKEEKIKFNVDYWEDSDFTSFARLLQSKWREKKQFPKQKYGNCLDLEFATTTKANYLTDNIKRLVAQKVEEAKENNAMIKEPRIWNNLLSSQPLCFNLFGELYYDYKLATKYFSELFPGRIDKITSIDFEYSAGRGDRNYTGDHSAFDVFMEFEDAGKKCFMGIEVKYSENLREETEEKADYTFKKHRKEYTRLTTEKHFKSNAIEFVRLVPLSQIWRDHLLSIAHLKDYDDGFFVFLFPKGNNECQSAVNEYRGRLSSFDERQTGFYSRYLDDFIEKLTTIHDVAWTRELKERYLGYNL